jgi:MFS family permease
MTESAAAGAGAGPATRAGRWQPAEIAALVVVCFAGLATALNMSLLIPVLPVITADLHSSGSATEWLLTSTLLTSAIAVPVAGRLGDLYGKKKMLLASASLLVAGSLLSALGGGLPAMIAGRAVVGLSSGIIPLGISLLTNMLPRERVASGVALVSAMLGIGGALGVPFAAWVGGHSDYHVLFWITVGAGLVSMAGTWRLLAEPPGRAAGRLDLPGTVVLAAALVLLLLPLSQAASWGWGSAATLGPLAGAVVLLVAFVAWERRSPSPLVDVVANARPALLLTNLASGGVGFALFATLIGTASYVEAPAATGYGFGSSILAGGLCLLPSGLAMLVLAPVSAAITNRFGPKVSLSAGAAVIAIGFLGRIVLDQQLWEIVVGTAVASGGAGIAYAAMPTLIARAAPRSELAAANGLNTLSRAVGSSVASAIGGTLFASQLVLVAGQAYPSHGAYRLLFGLCAAAAVLAALIASTVPVRGAVSAVGPPAEEVAGSAAAEPAAAG